jgi:tripartite-type tricarboxylate transporter receptor subunit TctC
MAAVQKATGAKALMVTYRGGAPAVADLQAGVIDMMFELTPGLMPLIEQGVVSPLAVGSAKRVGALPDVPGMAEFADIGLGGVDINAWEALMAPAGTPADVAERLNAAVRRACADSAMQEKLRASGFSAEASESPAALAAKIQREIPLWRKLVEDSGAKLDT